MKDNLLELMEHIDYFFENIPLDYDESKKFEVFLKDKKWQITNLEDGKIFGTTDHKDAYTFLIENKIDLLDLHRRMFQSICTEGVLRRRQIVECEKLVGKEAIDKSEIAWKAFTDALVGTIKKELVDEKTSLALVD